MYGGGKIKYTVGCRSKFWGEAVRYSQFNFLKLDSRSDQTTMEDLLIDSLLLLRGLFTGINKYQQNIRLANSLSIS